MQNEELWIKLPATEIENYVKFHENAFKEDLAHAERNVFEFPRWSIISGYYCMHDVTKLFFAKNYGLKITSPGIHIKTIRALEHFINDEKLKVKLLKLLKEAKNVYFNAERLKEKVLPVLLKKGKEERGKSQYYTEDFTKSSVVDSKKADYFLETVVRPYVKIMEALNNAT